MQLILGIIIFIFSLSVGQEEDSIKELVDSKLLKPLRMMHDPANAAMFSRAYVGSVWKYELFTKPNEKNKYFLYQLREYRGVFVVDQVNFKVYLDKGTITLEDWESGSYINVETWLEKYKNEKGQAQ